jgi:hypothetical protein
MAAVGIIGAFNSPSLANDITGFFIAELSKSSSNIVRVDTENKLTGKTSSPPHKYKDIKTYTCLVHKCRSTFLHKYNFEKHCSQYHGIDKPFHKEDREFSVSYNPTRVYYCHFCQNENEFTGANSFRVHLQSFHKATNVVFKWGNLLSYKFTNAPARIKCYTCYKEFDTEADQKYHLKNFNHNDYFQCYYPDCTRTFSNYIAVRAHYRSFHSESIKYTPSQFCMAYKSYKAMQEAQSDINATKTTTNNMDSTRKRSHSLGIHEEESNAKKAMLNPSDTLSSISNSCEVGLTFGDRFLDIITADDSFVTPIAGNIDSINTAFQFSDTSQDIDDTELLELARELPQTNNDFKTALSGDASYSAASRDSYLQFSVTPKKV